MLYKTCTTGLSAFKVFLSLRKRAHPFILDSTTGYGHLGRYSFVGATPFLTFCSRKNKIVICNHDKITNIIKGDPFEELRKLLSEYRIPYFSHYPPFVGGAVGYLGYDLCRFIEDLPSNAVDDLEIGDAFFGFYDGIYVFDSKVGTVGIAALGVSRDAKETVECMEEHLRHTELKPPKISPYVNMKETVFKSNMSVGSYLKAIARIREYIKAGDIYQTNFTQRFECSFNTDIFAFYERLRFINPAPFSAYIDAGDCVILSCSPERFMRTRGNLIETRPIKGTIKRGATSLEDARLAEELLGSDKDRSELLVIVDLERNDLGHIAMTGTVRVPELFALESYPTVHHLVATITAEVRPECDLIDCIKALFPGGSITGAPKIRSMEIIDELEPTRRNVYTGSIGYLGFDGSADLNIAIRTIVMCSGTAYLQVGGGITWESDPEKEYGESLIKAKALMEALS